MKIRALLLLLTAVIAQAAGAATSDFDGDGKSEAVWLSTRFGRAEVWKLNAVLAAPDVFRHPTGETDMKLVGVGDIDGDGLADIVMQHGWTLEVRLLTHFTDGGYQAQSLGKPEGFGSSRRLAGVGDFDGDGNAELLLRDDFEWRMYVIEVSGATMATPVAVYQLESPDWQVAAIADFDRDGKDDVLWQHAASRAVAIWSMDGAHLARSAYVATPGEPGWRIAGAADFTADEQTDILWQNTLTGGVAVWAMHHVELFQSHYIYTLSDPDYRVHGVGDYDGDGANDILWAGERTGFIYTWLMNGLSIRASHSIGRWADAPTWTGGGMTPQIVSSARVRMPFFNDNAKDNAGENSDVFRLSGGTLFVDVAGNPNPLTLDLGPGWVVGRPADYDRDGVADVVASNGSVLRYILRRGADQFFTADVALSPNWRIVTGGVFSWFGDNDPQPDLLFMNDVTGEFSGWELSVQVCGSNRCASPVAHSARLVAAQYARPGWRVVGMGDFGGDRQDDLLLQNPVSGQVELLILPTYSASSYLFPATPPEWRVGGIGDFDRDGDLDIIRQNLSTGEVSIWLMNGTSIVETRPITTIENHPWRIQGVGDYDGNGTADVLWRRADTNDTVFWRMQGTQPVESIPLGVRTGAIAGASEAVQP